MKGKIFLYVIGALAVLFVLSCSTTTPSGGGESSSSSVTSSSVSSTTSSSSTSSSGGGAYAVDSLNVPSWLQGAWQFSAPYVGITQRYWVGRSKNIYDAGGLINKANEFLLYETNISSTVYAFYQYTTGSSDLEKQTNGYLFIQIDSTNILVSNYQISVFGEDWTLKGNLYKFTDAPDTIVSAATTSVDTPNVPYWLLGEWLYYPSINYNFTTSNITWTYYTYPGSFYGIQLTMAEASGTTPRNYYTADYIHAGQLTESQTYLASSDPKKAYVYKLVGGTRILSYNITNKD